MFSRIPTHYWALFTLCVWGGAIVFFHAVRFDAYALDEGAAHALLLNWSVADQIVTTIATYGGPDFRALLFIPLGLYWPGSMIAAKVFTIIIMFGGVMGLYYWSRKHQTEEIALIATGLLLISPATIQLIDQMSAGPYLLLMFTVGAWLDNKYRNSPHSISSLYFIQCIVVAITVTLHPMGLAYPAALAWHWHKNPKPGENPDKQKKQVWLGIGISVLIILAMQTGWIDLAWLSNPATSLEHAVLGKDPLANPQDTPWIGYIVLLLLGVTVYLTARTSLNTLKGSMLTISLLLGLVCADLNWALFGVITLLYSGTPLLIDLNKKAGMNNFIGQRGLLMLAIIVVTSVSMQANKSHTQIISTGLLSDTDQLIQTLAKEAADAEQPFLAASQWPARTMIVCRRDVLKLPPPAENGEALLTSIRGLTHVMFNHRDPANSQLAKNFSEITAHTETLSIQDGGVIIKLRNETITPRDDEPGKIDEKQQPLTNGGDDVPDIDVPPTQ